MARRRNPRFKAGARVSFPGDHGVRVAGRYLGMETPSTAAVCEEDAYALLQDSPEGGEAYTQYVDLGDVRPLGHTKESTKMATSKSRLSLRKGSVVEVKLAGKGWTPAIVVQVVPPGGDDPPGADVVLPKDLAAYHSAYKTGHDWEHYVIEATMSSLRAPGRAAAAKRTKSARSTSTGRVKLVNGRYEVGGGKWFGTKAKAEAYLRKHG